MKRIIALFTTLTALLLTGCSGNSKSVSTNQSEPTDSEPVSTNQSEPTDPKSEEYSSDENKNIELDDETLALIQDFSLDSFVGFDGNTVEKSEAVAAEKGLDDCVYLTFDFAYMRYATPIWKNSAENPDLIDWNTLEYNDDTSIILNDPKYFKVKQGDVLENGLTVESAKSVFYAINECDEDGNISKEAVQLRNEIALSGELTLNGILHCVSGDSDYIDSDGDLLFFADTSDFSYIPVPSTSNSGMDIITKSADASSVFAIVCDGYRFYLGNINTVSTDLSGIIDSGDYLETEITLDNIRISYSDVGGKIVNADIVCVN